MPADQQPPGVRGDALATLLYVANWRFVLNGQSYFDQYATPSPFLHMWSLGIEEQWYLVFPLLLAALIVLVRARARAVAAVLAVAAVGSAVLMAVLFVPGSDPSRAYYSTFTRAQDLLVGSVLAVLLARRPVAWAPIAHRGTRRVAAAAGVLGVLTLLVAFGRLADSDDGLFRGGFLVISVLSAVLVVSLVLAPDGPAARVLALRPVAAVGAISYGLYLWHWPVDVYVTSDTTVLSGPALFAVRFGLAFALATASYWLVERPVRRGALGRMPWPTGPVLATTSFVLALVVAVAFGTPAAGAGADTGAGLSAPTAGRTTAAVPRTNVLLVGDSVAEALAAGFPPTAHPQVHLTTSTRLGCGLGAQQVVVDGVIGLPNQSCADWPRPWREAVARDRPAVSVVLVGSWEVLDHRVDGRTLTVGSPAYATYLTGLLDQTEQTLGGDGRKVVLLDVPCYRQRSAAVPGPDIAVARNDPHRAAAVNDVLDRFAAAHPADVSVLRFGAFLCPDGRFQDSAGGVPLRPDGVHPSRAGAARIWDWLIPHLGLPGGSGPSPTPSVVGPAGPVRAYLVGDSVPFGLRQQFRAGSLPGLQVGGSTRLGCGLLPYDIVVDGRKHDMDPGCPAWSTGWRSAVAAKPVDVGVIFLGIGEQHDRLVSGSTVTFGSAADERFLDAQLDSMVAVFTEMGATVVLPTVPCHHVTQAGIPGDQDIINDERRVTWLDDVLRRYAAAHADTVRIYDLYAQVCPHGYTDSLNGVRLRTDGLHFSPAGAALVWSGLGPALIAAGRAAQARKG